jgi:hypothetical protein
MKSEIAFSIDLSLGTTLGPSSSDMIAQEQNVMRSIAIRVDETNFLLF